MATALFFCFDVAAVKIAGLQTRRGPAQAARWPSWGPAGAARAPSCAACSACGSLGLGRSSSTGRTSSWSSWRPCGGTSPSFRRHAPDCPPPGRLNRCEGGSGFHHIPPGQLFCPRSSQRFTVRRLSAEPFRAPPVGHPSASPGLVQLTALLGFHCFIRGWQIFGMDRKGWSGAPFFSWMDLLAASRTPGSSTTRSATTLGTGTQTPPTLTLRWVVSKLWRLT